MARYLLLTPYLTEYPPPAGRGCRVRVEASDAVEVSPKVFAYELVPAQPSESGSPVPAFGRFSHVCSAVDLEEYPEDGAEPDAEAPYFRLAYVDLVLPTVAQAVRAKDELVAAVAALVAALDRIDTLAALPPVPVGTPPT